jgi:hypothetical protein
MGAGLGEEPANPPGLKASLAPDHAEEMTRWPVSARGGKVKNNDPSSIEPTDLASLASLARQTRTGSSHRFGHSLASAQADRRAGRIGQRLPKALRAPAFDQGHQLVVASELPCIDIDWP